MTKYNGIKGLEGREPVGAVVTVGVKSTRGFPEQTDKFHIVQPREENGVRKYHPGFSQFNTAGAEHRKVIRGNIVHASKCDCFEFHLKAQAINKKMHPNKKPYCTGDGKDAMRWSGKGADDFNKMDCPHDRCEHRMTKPPLCKPFMRFLFKLRWKDGSLLPQSLVKLTSGSWNTTANFKGFFEYCESAASGLGLKEYTLFGFPFMLSLAYQTKPSEKTKFPVVTISPEIDPVDFFLQQRANIRELVVDVPIAITDQPEQEPVVVYEDVKAISKPTLF